jgi:CRP-like cAMP-binding protein
VLDALPAVLHAPQLTTAIAIADCEVLQIGLDEFERLRLSHRGMGGWIQGQLAREAAEYMDRWVAVGPKGTVQGMIWVLLQCFRVGGRTRPDGSIQMAFHLSVTALAEWLNVSRQTASEYLTFLKREGLIDVRSDWFVLPAHSPLQARMAVGNV